MAGLPYAKVMIVGVCVYVCVCQMYFSDHGSVCVHFSDLGSVRTKVRSCVARGCCLLGSPQEDLAYPQCHSFFMLQIL